MHPTSDDIRQRFIQFFASKPRPGEGHVHVPSSPVVPHDDPTLLFTNAGMNQFKPLFLGTVQPGSPLYGLKRAANSQKCIRAGGKHNDLEDVGKDTYHHTFFEMLGNWSFGDYFKAEAIEWAWELLTGVYGIAGDRLYATYFGGDEAAGLPPDEEARQLWLRHLPPQRVLPFGMKDNFWEMGETGPCGPCSEIHYDRIGGRDATALVNRGDPDVIEIWNLVFIQFDRRSASELVPLPARHVDTGMGLERLTSVLQNVSSNYDTDLFAPLFMAIETHTGAHRPYQGLVGARDKDRIDEAYRVIADHIRCLTFAITDGAVPSNEGRGYVLRRILRRAVRYGRQMLDAKTGFLSSLVPCVVGKMGEAFPELRRDPQRVIDVIREEEESFGKTLDRGIESYFDVLARTVASALSQPVTCLHAPGGVHHLVGQGIGVGRPPPAVDLADRQEWQQFVQRKQLSNLRIAGEDAFQLYDTYGFPLDLTQLMASELGISVDVEGFERCMEEQRERSRAGAKEGSDELMLPPDAIARLRHLNISPTDDSDKYHARDVYSTVRAIWNGQNFDEAITANTRGLRRVGIIFDRTNFYAEAGGQVADQGQVFVSRESKGARDAAAHGEFRVEDVRNFGGYVLHIGRVVRGEFRVGDQAHLNISLARRKPTQANHTATHLMNFALREVVGEHVDQKGSLVEPERLRFDFSNNGPVPPRHLGDVEGIVRNLIERDLPVIADIVPLAQAREINGVRAVFGEAYPDPVRVVSIGAPIGELLANPKREEWRRYSVEFCGGTHLGSTGEAVAFAIVTETGVAKGVRRIEAVTGAAALAAIAAADQLEARLREASTLTGAELSTEASAIAAAIDQMTMPVSRREKLRELHAGLIERVKQAQKSAGAEAAKRAAQLAKAIAERAAARLEEVVIEQIEAGNDRAALQAALKVIQDACPRSAVLLFSPGDGSVALIAGVSKYQIERGLRAGDWVREAAAVLGGKGGGRPEQAQGGGSDIARVPEAMEVAKRYAWRHLG